jgi:hypothetical protein
MTSTITKLLPAIVFLAVAPIAKADPLATGTASPEFNTAVSCAAALQVATLAAPTWGRETAIAQATNLWLARVFALAGQAGVAENQAKDVVRKEMDNQVNEAASAPERLSRRAADCAANRPA